MMKIYDYQVVLFYFSNYSQILVSIIKKYFTCWSRICNGRHAVVYEKLLSSVDRRISIGNHVGLLVTQLSVSRRC